MRALIEKLCSARTGSRDLDEEVAGAIGAPDMGGMLGEEINERYGPFYPAFTTSVDAVKKRVNQTWEWNLSKSNDGQHTACFIVRGDAFPAMAATPELAFCAAWLKAIRCTA